jgi:hypothetical protein
MLKSQCCHTYVSVFCQSIETVLKEINRAIEKKVCIILYFQDLL